MAAQRIYDLRGRVCLITGATSGIGRETAQGLAQSGATVLLVPRRFSPRGQRAVSSCSSVSWPAKAM